MGSFPCVREWNGHEKRSPSRYFSVAAEVVSVGGWLLNGNFTRPSCGSAIVGSAGSGYGNRPVAGNYFSGKRDVGYYSAGWADLLMSRLVPQNRAEVIARVVPIIAVLSVGGFCNHVFPAMTTMNRGLLGKVNKTR